MSALFSWVREWWARRHSHRSQPMPGGLAADSQFVRVIVERLYRAVRLDVLTNDWKSIEQNTRAAVEVVASEYLRGKLSPSEAIFRVRALIKLERGARVLAREVENTAA